MQFDLRKFIVSGTKPYTAEFQCDLSAKDLPVQGSSSL